MRDGVSEQKVEAAFFIRPVTPPCEADAMFLRLIAIATIQAPKRGNFGGSYAGEVSHEN